MPNSSPLASPPPCPATAASRSKKRFLTCQNSNQGLQDVSVANCLPTKDKRTRDLPNLSDCHGCGLRINYSNPKERLQLLESVWRIVLLCKKCMKLVNSRQICPYCFGDTVKFFSDCVGCSDCERLIHKDCLVKYNNSAPWSYTSEESGLGFSVCVDCWIPKLLKNSVRICRSKAITEKCGGESCASKGDSTDFKKGKDESIKSSEKVVKDANSAMEKKTACAVKAKEKALRKAVVAKNALLSTSNAMDLVEKDCSSKKSEGLLTSISNGSSVNEVTKFVNDAELAFQLHRAMNSSPRISRNTSPVNVSCLDILKLTDSISVLPKSDDLGSGEGGKVAACCNTLANEYHGSDNSATSVFLRTNGNDSAVSSLVLKPELKTYQRNATRFPVFKGELLTYKRRNKKRKESQENIDQENVENCYVGTSFGAAGEYDAGEYSRTVTEPQYCQQDGLKQESHVDDARSGDTRPDRYALKYSKRMTDLYKEVKFTQEAANSHSVSFQKETQASAPGLPMDCLVDGRTDCSMECRASSDSSLHSCVVNLQACASIGGSSQEEG